ncbi:hypothetical protein F5884DRAFT_891314 [Xylogone sp. PMI_703]|nr:hypothetical protein F5884DRAFT_891314 [Xylogone sp. PMI_703]
MKRVLTSAILTSLASTACISSGDETTINTALKNGGEGAIVQLCAGATINVKNTVTFTAANQELSTAGYPTDNTRATLHLVATDMTISAIVHGGNLNGIRLMNIQLDGDRATNGQIVDGGSSANIEMGGVSTGVVVSHVASKNPRGWSCMHIGEGEAASGTKACTNATITNNDIGPCGLAGRDSAGHGRWADGISFGCSNSLIQGNSVTGSTDGGIVLFGAPGTKVISNTITSSSTEAGFGAINLVDNLSTYSGSFSGVQVTGNTIHGDLLFGAGIAIGSCVWVPCDASSTTAKLSGPVTITNNKFTGSIAFPIPVSGWQNGITVTGNDVSGVPVSSSFAEAGQCTAPTKDAFRANQHLIWNSPSVTGPTNFQSGFVQHTDYPSHFICPTPPLPNNIIFKAGGMDIKTVPDSFAELHNGIQMTFDNSAHIIVYNISGDTATVETTVGATTTCNNDCELSFQGDGNWVKRKAGAAFWNSGTSGKGSTLTALNTSPWFQIKDSSGAVIWDAINNCNPKICPSNKQFQGSSKFIPPPALRANGGESNTDIEISKRDQLENQKASRLHCSDQNEDCSDQNSETFQSLFEHHDFWNSYYASEQDNVNNSDSDWWYDCSKSDKSHKSVWPNTLMVEFDMTTLLDEIDNLHF